MDPLDRARIGTTDLEVTRLGQGGAAIGGLYSSVDEEDAVATLRRAVDLGLTLFDTAPFYGRGKSERLVGKALQAFPRNDYVLSTKVGRLLVPAELQSDDPFFADLPPLEIEFDYSRDGILRSIDDSLERLGLDRIDVALVHDPDDHYEQAIGEAFPTLADLRSQGVVKAVGAGMNQWEMLARFAREGDFDCFLLAGRYTLLDQSSLAELLPICEEKTISIIVGGPFNSGILASDLSPEATYDYAAAPPDVLERARKIKAVCDRHDVPLKAAALQFGLAHPAVAATVPGARSVAESNENFAMVAHPIPTDLWAELKSENLIAQESPTPELEKRRSSDAL